MKPLVSVVTPVYNDEPYIEECIDSVLTQQYSDFEYIICDNHSTDRSGEIARDLARTDERVRVIQPPTFLPQAPNFNFALTQIAREAQYVKLIFSDDRLFEHCVGELVAVAAAAPKVGIVGSYGIVETVPICFGLPTDQAVFRGSDVLREQLLGRVYPFGSNTNLLLRADLVRERAPRYFPEGRFFFDLNVAFEVLQHHDFGFVHQVLSFTRKQADSLMVQAFSMRSDPLMDLVVAKEYGAGLLDSGEFQARLDELTSALYLSLGRQWIEDKLRRCRNDDVWEFHARELGAVGVVLDRRRLAVGVVRALGAAAANSGTTVSKLRERLGAGS